MLGAGCRVKCIWMQASNIEDGNHKREKALRKCSHHTKRNGIHRNSKDDDQTKVQKKILHIKHMNSKNIKIGPCFLVFNSFLNSSRCTKRAKKEGSPNNIDKKVHVRERLITKKSSLDWKTGRP